MKKIIHLSDTHIGYKALSKRMGDIVTRMIFHKRNADDYVIVHTGDIVEDATEKGSYDEALVHFNRLKKAGFRILYAPGNHDYGTGAWGSKKYMKKFKRKFLGSKNLEYPIKTIIDEIAFLGLDSMADELHFYDRFSAEGELGKKQRRRLSRLLEKDSEVKDAKHRVVYLHHHPFHPKPFHHLKDSEKLGNILQKHDISALLFGHNHDGKIWNGEWGIPRIYDGGTSTGKKGKPSPHRVIDLSKEPAYDYDADF
uniref:Calcineurin-like phosphoesterase n=1 Tax=Candidatus Kentrum sp. UNK TaxID=2126344 RepID=A0A451B4K7_9GAMM|nr:MAG: Calcineurin-like phosphoesterase [Candidatus Kentron sp. UNK]VFK73177.1 MAG: Calcineurin-like phosphoesterase [Candidatus Kentron sp. UNK]